MIIRECMVPSPHTIGREQTLERASQLMREHRVRHLPVLDGAKLLGIVSQRDIYFIEGLKDVDPATVTVEEAMSPEPYVVSPEAPVEAVVEAMAEHKYGAAVVMKGNTVAGIFTTIDALHLLHSLLAKKR